MVVSLGVPIFRVFTVPLSRTYIQVHGSKGVRAIEVL